MAVQTTAEELARLVETLQQERAEHVQAIEEIDAMFRRYGIEPDAAPAPRRRGRPARKKGAARRGRPRGAAAKKTTQKKSRRGRKRGSFPVTGEESVLAFIKSHGKPNAAEVNEHWNAEGRGGKADNTLTKLVQAGRIQRIEAPGERGGRYKLA